LLVFQGDKFGCFAPLSGVFPSVFVQAVWAVVDLTKKGRGVRWFVGKIRKEGKPEKKRKKPQSP
jgi:hypothetical protein